MMNYPPYQMNQTAAAAYMCVSISTFKHHHRPHLRQYKEGGVVYFLKNDIEKYCRSRFITKTSANKHKVAPNKEKMHCYEDALKKITSNNK